ncbi:Hypothetical protein D9617_4g004330 [Elsinoe fawcettii]|nr:Hypothetical protein D9617_4g004330 [Elsinoe fawcettii]
MDSGRSFGPDDFVGATFIHQDEDSVADHELCERLNILLESHDEPQCSVFGSNPPTNVSSMAAWSHNTGSSGDGLGRSTRSAFSSHSIYRPVSGKTAQHLSYLRGNTNPSTRSQRREYTYQPTPSKRGTVRYETPRRENTGLAQSLHIDTKESSLENQRGIPILPPKTLDAASKLIPPWNVPEPPCNESLDRVIRTSDESQPCRPAEPRLERIPRSWNRSPSPFRPGEFPESRRPTRTSLSEDLARFEQYMRSAKREVAAPREHSSNHDSIIGNLRTMQLRPTDNHSDILSAQDGPVPAVATIIKIASTGLQDGEVEHVESLP